ncbi:MAG: AmpG family muropeptide MFS transporter [Syntrophobacteraceae bacterium]|nr:AmpG family muropeptide MFS transporter [Syntrophobacteraceae bacterium]
MKTGNWIRTYGNRRVLCLVGLGFSSGLPLALTASTLQAWLVTEKVNLGVIGMFSLVSLPYTLKVLWSPLLDRFSMPWLGRRRGWIISFQVLLALSIFLLGRCSPVAFPLLVALAAMLTAFLSSSQDVVIDAYRTDVLRESELGPGAAAGAVGYRCSMIVSGALALILSDHLPWRTVYALMAVVMLVSSCFTLLAPEPEVRVEPPGSLKEAVWGPLVSYFKRSGAVEMLFFIMIYKLGSVMAGTMTTPFLLDIGFSRTDVGMVNKVFGLITTIVGTLVGGRIIAGIGINRSLWVFGIAQAMSNFSFAALSLIGKSFPALVVAVGIENTFGGMGDAAFIAFFMSLCDKRFTATQYALLTSFMAVDRVVAGAPMGAAAQALGWPAYFSLSVLAAVPGLLLLTRFAPWNGGGRAVAVDGG